MSEKHDQMISLPGGEFAMWPMALVRSAGMPGSWVERLEDPALVDAAEQVFAAEARVEDARYALLRALQDRADATVDDAHHAVIKDMRKVRRGRLPSGEHADHQDFGAARTALDRARERFATTYEEARKRVRSALCQLGRDDLLRAAVAWQNPRALSEGIDRLLAAGDVDNKQTRKYEHLLASYVQRYCVKNDSIGFFGPLGWAEFDPEVAGIEHTPGERVIASHRVYFEGWSIARMAAMLGQDERLRPWLRPRRLPLVGLHQGAAYLPFSAKPVDLGPVEFDLVALSDGRRHARSLADEVMNAHDIGDRDEVFALLQGLAKKGLIAWKLEVPLDFRPEEHLRAILEDIGDDALRREFLDKLERLTHARDATAEVAQDAAALVPALSALDATFHELTGEPASHSHGKVYAGRTVAFIEARRADRVRMGRALIDAMGPTMTILMHAARWFTREMALVYRKELGALYEKLAKQVGGVEVPYLRFWLAAQRLFQLRPSARAPLPPYVQELVDRFVHRWGQILDHPDPDAHLVRYRSEDIRGAVDRLFQAPGPGWIWARYGSPDIMIDAESADAVARGEFKIVLGEFHMAVQSFLSRTGIQHHPDPARLFAMVDALHQEPLLCPLIPSDMFPHRVHLYLNNHNGYELSFAPEMPTRTRGTQLLAGELLVTPRDGDDVAAGVAGDLVARTRDGRISFDLLETVGVALMSTCLNSLSFMRRGAHRPRIEIDKVVVQREAWYPPVSGLDFAAARSGHERFIGAQRWAQEHGVPRRVFIAVPVEEKPMYIDLGSPILVDILCKLVRASRAKFPDSTIAISEMLPAQDRLWLEDSAGNRYTSELRCSIFDPEKPAATVDP